MIPPGFCRRATTKTKSNDDKTTVDGAFRFELGAGQDKPYLQNTSDFKIAGNNEGETINGEISTTMILEKSGENQLTVTFQIKAPNQGEAEFVSVINVAADKTCKFKVGNKVELTSAK